MVRGQKRRRFSRENLHPVCTWPLAKATAFENIDAALKVLRQACEYLHQGLAQVGAAVEQKVDTGKVQAAVQEIAEQIQLVRTGVMDGVSRQKALSTRIDGIMERISAAHGRLEP